MKPSEQVEHELARIAEAATKLNDRADEINEYIEDLEDRLSQYGAGVEVWIAPVPPLSPRQSELGYCKVDGNWKFCTREGGPGEVQILTRSSRQMRLLAIEVLPNLLTAIGNELTEFANQLD